MAGLKQRAVSATLWSAADILLRRGVGFFITLVLVRLVTPGEYGVVALTAMFLGIAGTFADGGFAAALIQRQGTTVRDESTVFWFNVTVGAIASLLLFVVAPWVGDYFSQAVLGPILQLVSITVFIGALGSIQFVLLEKELDFRTQMFIGAVSTVASGVVAIWLALKGYGAWALAWQQVVAAGLTTALVWLLHPWRPALVFSRVSARSLFGFGGFVFATNLIEVAFARLYTVLVGKLFGVRELGFYNRADSTQQLPAGLMTQILMRVAFPVFSAATNDKAQLRRGVRVAVRSVMLLNAPVLLGLAAVSKPLVATLFGARWTPAAPILQVLCLAGLLSPLHRINLTVLVAQGHSRLFFNLGVLKKTLGVLLLIGGTTMGVMGVAWAMVVSSAAEFFINAWFTARYLDYGAVKQARDIAPVIVLSLVMAIFVHALGVLMRSATPLTLLAQIVAGIVLMAALIQIFKLGALRDVIGLLFRARQPSELGVK